MPTFRKDLPPLGKHQGFDLKRTPETGALNAIVTCEDFVVCDTHYYHGRTGPCERIFNDEGKTIDDSPCAACRDKVGYRTHVYLSAFIVKTCEHFIFECSNNAAKSLDDYRKATGTLRGCVIYANRPKGLKNSKVVIETGTVNLAKVKLPNAPDLVKALSVIWRLPITALDTKKNAKKNGQLHTNNAKIRELDTQPDSMADPASVGDILSQSRF